MKFTYTGIEVKDLDKSIAFYRDVVGMEFLGRGKIEATGGEVAALKSAGSEHTLELNWYPDSRYRGGNELDHLAFECEDVRRDVDRLLKAGATMARPVEVRPKYVVGFVKDPDGIWLELYQERRQGLVDRPRVQRHAVATAESRVGGQSESNSLAIQQRTMGRPSLSTAPSRAEWRHTRGTPPGRRSPAGGPDGTRATVNLG